MTICTSTVSTWKQMQTISHQFTPGGSGCQIFISAFTVPEFIPPFTQFQPLCWKTTNQWDAKFDLCRPVRRGTGHLWRYMRSPCPAIDSGDTLRHWTPHESVPMQVYRQVGEEHLLAELAEGVPNIVCNHTTHHWGTLRKSYQTKADIKKW